MIRSARSSRWVPTSKSTPPPLERVLVYLVNGDCDVLSLYGGRGGGWWPGGIPTKNALAWMPLPQAPPLDVIVRATAPRRRKAKERARERPTQGMGEARRRGRGES